MNTTLYYYTGTGNSLWAARLLARELGWTEVLPLRSSLGRPIPQAAEAVGLVFPVHMWGAPHPVLRFVRSLASAPAERDRYWFAVAVMAGQVARALVQLRRVMRRGGLTLASGYSLTLPLNYTPFGGPGPREKQERLFAEARNKIRRIAADLRSREPVGIEMGPLASSLAFSLLNRLTAPIVPRMDRFFRADGRCNGCGLCARICPAGNIALPEGRPRWLRRCEQCFACLQWCPEQAIQVGRNTARIERYRHPEVAVQDMLAGVPDSP